LASDKPVTLAAVTGAHGVAGEVRLKLLGDGFAALAAHGSVGNRVGRNVEIQTAHGHKGGDADPVGPIGLAVLVLYLVLVVVAIIIQVVGKCC